MLVSHTQTLNLAKVYLTTLPTKGLLGALFYDKYFMNTQFYNPTVIIEHTIFNEVTGHDSIGWDVGNAISQNNYATSKQPLYTISGLWMEKFLSNTSELWCTNLNIPDNNLPVTGIQFFLDMHRFSRIEDLRIQLILNNELIGDNQASPVDPVQSNMYTGDNSPLLPIIGDANLYGEVNNMWGTSLTSEDIANPSFGIAISFRSNQVYPHRDLVIVNQIGVSITYG